MAKSGKIVVSGASGFLGSWVCRILSQSYSVTALVRPESDNLRLLGIKNLEIARVPSGSWAKEINAMRPDALISMEWWGVESKNKDSQDQYSNVYRSKKMLEEIGPVSLLLGTGSQAELGPVSSLTSEDHPDLPTTEYGKCKVLVRNLFREKAQQSGARFAWARVFSTYGALDSSSWIIPATMRHISSGREMQLTLGEQRWSFLHAYDLARAVESIVSNEAMSDIINIGNPETVSVKEVATRIAAIYSRPELLKFGSIPYSENQVMRLEPICESLTSVGWSPMVSLDAGLMHLHKWLIEKTNSPLALKDGTSEYFNLPISP